VQYVILCIVVERSSTYICQLVFNPTSVTAAVGDTISFQLYVSAIFYSVNNCSQALYSRAKNHVGFRGCKFVCFSY
jgi:hypothetical protein